MDARIALVDRKGQAMVEFAFILTLITVAIVTTVSLMSEAVQGLFQSAVDSLS